MNLKHVVRYNKDIIKMNRIKKILKNRFGSDFFELIKHGKNYISADLFSQDLAFISIPIILTCYFV